MFDWVNTILGYLLLHETEVALILLTGVGFVAIGVHSSNPLRDETVLVTLEEVGNPRI